MKSNNRKKDQYIDQLINPSFQGDVLPFKNNEDRAGHKKHFIPNVEIKDYNVMIDGQNFFDQSVKNDLRTQDDIQKIITGQGDGYKTVCLLHYLYYKKYYTTITINLSTQKAFDTDPKALQQINFTENLDRDRNPTFFIIEQEKETILGFSQGTVRVL